MLTVRVSVLDDRPCEEPLREEPVAVIVHTSFDRDPDHVTVPPSKFSVVVGRSVETVGSEACREPRPRR
jgi:hypothetical protein